MYFKAAQIAVISDSSFKEELKQTDINEALKRLPFKHCGAIQEESFGFIQPIKTAENLLAVPIGDFILFKCRHEVKHLPPKAISQMLLEKCDEMEQKEGRRPGKKEREEMKELIRAQLLPVAIPVSTTQYGWFDLKRGWLVVGVETGKKMDIISGYLRQCIGSMPVIPAKKLLDLRTSLSDSFTAWYRGVMPDELKDVSFSMPIKLVMAQDTASCSTHRSLDLDDPAIMSGLENGMRVVQFGAVYDERFYAKLDDHLILRGIKFDDKLLESDGNNIDLATDFLISINAITSFYESLFEALTLKTGV